MKDRAFPLLRLTALAAVLALSACNWFRGDDKGNPANDSDPEIAAALNDQILVDGNLDNQSNRNGGRNPAGPGNSRYPSPDAASPGAKGPDAPPTTSPAAAPGSSPSAPRTIGRRSSIITIRGRCGPAIRRSTSCATVTTSSPAPTTRTMAPST